MPHIPINHHLRPVYRALAALCALYVLIFGIVGVVRSGNLGTFVRTGVPSVLGLHANRAFAVASIVAGLVILAGLLIGRNVDIWINGLGGIGFLVSGFVMMTLLRTDLNVFAFTMTTCVVSFVIGLVLATAGLYCKIGTPMDVQREEAFRHGGSAREALTEPFE